MAQATKRLAAAGEAVKRVRLSCTASAPIGEAVEQLLWSGLYGRTRAHVVERLICEAIAAKARDGVLKLEDLQEPPAIPQNHSPGDSS